ncbi:MAG: SMI1/KNR4 family protein [Peptococcaceae bacterium]|jgi:hypothetical protein|nr:SMI1/KNR4 family protein [Peptococcaceae bacterium]
MLIIEEDSFVEGASNNRINKLERYSRVKYPNSFIDFLKTYNGGVPVSKKLKAHNNEYVVERFLCLVDSPNDSPLGAYDIAVVLTQLGERLQSPELEYGDELIPIASLFAGNFVCMDYRESKTNPKICIWDHEESEDFAPATYFIANSFEEFIDMLELLE